jgi:hypothetical protein
MFIIFGTVVILLIAYFWQTIYMIISSFASGANNAISTGNIWFVGLLIINVVLLVFVFSFYYYKSNIAGKQGPIGNRGFEGPEGSGCAFDDGCKKGF